MQKISSYHLFILEIQWILESCDQLGHTHFWPCPPKIFLINFYFMRICINKQKIRLFHWFVLEIWFIKKSCNLIGWEHFGRYLFSNKLFQIWDLYRNTANINFHYKTNSVKIKTKFFNKFKTPCFWPIYDLLSQC